MSGATRLLAVALFTSVVALPGHASQAAAQIVAFDNDRTIPESTISESRAREIAWSAGLVHVEEITRTSDRWELAGRTVDDDEMILDIDVRDGRILN
ncbi:hypothetical protein [Bosea sp. UNC402CLCol]|jgi:hypothetical protein|uniref:hypothetical protein n=1 Tax=unclassified Bosea (in: a-proteobacteria) TaxID=2653178 RepID=UPI0012DFF093|nr:hypothetical protein [Bosea sp. UNC402CLCol]